MQENEYEYETSMKSYRDMKNSLDTTADVFPIAQNPSLVVTLVLPIVVYLLSGLRSNSICGHFG